MEVRNSTKAQVLYLIEAGFAEKEIAGILGVTARAVAMHKNDLGIEYKKKLPPGSKCREHGRSSCPECRLDNEMQSQIYFTLREFTPLRITDPERFRALAIQFGEDFPNTKQFLEKVWGSQAGVPSWLQENELEPLFPEENF